MSKPPLTPPIAIACGGTGGHLFPGLAVADALREAGASPLLFVSSKEVDRRALPEKLEHEVKVLDAVGWDGRHPWRFVRGTLRAWRQTEVIYRQRRPHAVLAMGGFTSLAPVLAARRRGAPAFLHESNVIPGRANRWLARWVEVAFVGFPEAGARLRAHRVEVVGTPVRPGFGPRDPRACRRSLGLEPERPTLVITGGSQGARAINRLVVGALPWWRRHAPELQFIHITGGADLAEVETAYLREQRVAKVWAFSESMEAVLGAGDLAIGRSGASFLAELAATRLPALLIPLPSAADDHQCQNARAYSESGAARMLAQTTLTAEALAREAQERLRDLPGLAAMRSALAQWHRPAAARDMAQVVLRGLARGPAAAEGGLRPGDRCSRKAVAV